MIWVSVNTKILLRKEVRHSTDIAIRIQCNSNIENGAEKENWKCNVVTDILFFFLQTLGVLFKELVGKQSLQKNCEG